MYSVRSTPYLVYILVANLALSNIERATAVKRHGRDPCFPSLTGPPSGRIPRWRTWLAMFFDTCQFWLAGVGPIISIWNEIFFFVIVLVFHYVRYVVQHGLQMHHGISYSGVGHISVCAEKVYVIFRTVEHPKTIILCRMAQICPPSPASYFLSRKHN